MANDRLKHCVGNWKRFGYGVRYPVDNFGRLIMLRLSFTILDYRWLADNRGLENVKLSPVRRNCVKLLALFG